MILKYSKTIPLLLLLYFLSNCSRQNNIKERGFYYWKTTFSLDSQSVLKLQQLNIKHIYTRFFDVDWNTEKMDAVPVSKIQFLSPLNHNFNYIPVVYITNNTLKNIASEKIKKLADNIYTLVDTIANKEKITFNEFQIDCDWSETTKDNFFKLAELLKAKSNRVNKRLSATIRLHQIKYYTKTGIPPCDKAVLMFYNMGSIDSCEKRNSIFNMEDAKKYITSVKKYPLHLDVALPLFSWTIQKREGKVINLLNHVTADSLIQTKKFLIKNKQFIAMSSFLFHGKYIMKDDIFIAEQIDAKKCEEAAKLLSSSIKNEKRSIILFDLNEIIINSYNEKTFEAIFNHFN